jgi:hypothetical protein
MLFQPKSSARINIMFGFVDVAVVLSSAESPNAVVKLGVVKADE